MREALCSASDSAVINWTWSGARGQRGKAWRVIVGGCWKEKQVVAVEEGEGHSA